MDTVALPRSTSWIAAQRGAPATAPRTADGTTSQIGAHNAGLVAPRGLRTSTEAAGTLLRRALVSTRRQSMHS